MQQVAQADCEGHVLGNIKNLTGHCLEHLALVDSRAGLDDLWRFFPTSAIL